MNRISTEPTVFVVRLDFVLKNDSEELYSGLDRIYEDCEDLGSHSYNSAGKTLHRHYEKFTGYTDGLGEFEEVLSFVVEGQTDHFLDVVTIGVLSELQLDDLSIHDYSQRGFQFRKYRREFEEISTAIPTIVSEDEFSPNLIYAETEQGHSISTRKELSDGTTVTELDQSKANSFIDENHEALRKVRFNAGGYVSLISDSYLVTPEAVQGYWGPLVLVNIAPLDFEATSLDEWKMWISHVYREAIGPIGFFFKCYHWKHLRQADLDEIDQETYSNDLSATQQSSLFKPVFLETQSEVAETRDKWVSTFVKTVDEHEDLERMLRKIDGQKPHSVQDEQITLDAFQDSPPAEDVSLLSKYQIDIHDKFSAIEQDRERIESKLESISRVVHDRANLSLQNRVYWLTLALTALTVVLVIIAL